MAVAEAIVYPDTGSAPLAPGETAYRIERLNLRPNSYTLTLRGYLTTGWSGRLASGVAQHRISIVRGEAERNAAHVWHSSFEIKGAPLAQDPLAIDYAALAQKEIPAHSAPARIELSDFLLQPAVRHGGSLYLEVKGEDRIGFLGDLLDYFSFKCLFPVKMTIETVGETIFDKFWLRGVGGSIPSDSLYASLCHDLDTLRRR